MADRGVLDKFIELGTEIMKSAEPGWELSDRLKHPVAVSYDNRDDLLYDVKEGDQVMVLTEDGYWHHGIFVGGMPVMVVDVWGVDKESAKISARPYGD